MIQRYKKADTLSALWFSSITCFFRAEQSLSLKSARLSIGHLKEGSFFPEYPIISAELGLSRPQSETFHHSIRKVSKYTFSMHSDAASMRWGVLECFINEVLPEMDTYIESKLRAQRGVAIQYRRRGRCLEFVRAQGLKTARTTWRREPYPMSLTLRHSMALGSGIKNLETYFRMLRLPIRIYRRINRWWLAKKYWVWW